MQIWDAPTRIFHWLLALCFAGAYVSAKLGAEWMEWHLRAGYLMAVLLLFRLVWGFCGSSTARFGQFLKSPRQVWCYLRLLSSEKRPQEPGHNPAGGWMILLMLAVLGAVTITGLFTDDLVAFAGPLAACVSSEQVDLSARYHELGSDLALALIGLHVLAIALYSLVLKQHLLPAMLGRGSSPELQRAQPRIVSSWIALVIFVTIATGIYGLVTAELCGA